jgi:hypothetical protein
MLCLPCIGANIETADYVVVKISDNLLLLCSEVSYNA